MMKTAYPVLLALFLTACGGGSSSLAVTGSGSSVSADGKSRTISATCPFSQHLAAARGDGQRIAAVSWLQTSELGADSATTRLMAGKPVLARVDILSDTSALAPATRDLLVYDSVNRRCERIALTGPARSPAGIDRETLDTAYTATIPARLIQPGMSVSVVLDDNSGRSSTEADRGYRVYAPKVAEETREVLRIIPLRYRSVDGYVQSSANLAALLVRLHPLAGVTTRVESVFSPPSLSAPGLPLLSSPGEASFTTMQHVLDEVDNECARLNGAQSSARAAPKCLGVFPDNIVFRPDGDPSGKVVGLAYVGGTTMITESVAGIDVASVSSPYVSDHWLEFRALTVAHEMGHLLNLDHANCGGASGNDARLYSNGRLGGKAGYDSGRGFYFSSLRNGADGKPQFADLMSYCSKEWTSDRGYLAAMDYRSPAARSSARGSADDDITPARWLKISRTSTGWESREVNFAPASLQASDLTLGVLSNLDSELLPLTQAVISDVAGSAQGPYYINLGDRQVESLQLLKAGVLIQDLLGAVLKGS